MNVSGNITANNDLTIEADNINNKSIALESFYEIKGSTSNDEYHKIEQTLTNTSSNLISNNGQLKLNGFCNDCKIKDLNAEKHLTKISSIINFGE